MIIYIHGFGGSGEGSKATFFRKYFESIGRPFIAPSLSYIPELAIKTLEELISQSHEDVYLIGSSLGGYYTLYLSTKQRVKKAVVINPSIYPMVTLKRCVGNAPSFYDESTFTWRQSHLDMLQQYEVTELEKTKLMLLAQKGDEVLDYKEAVDKLDGCSMYIEEDGSHSFEGIERYFESIKDFFK